MTMTEILQAIQTAGLLPFVVYFLIKILPDMNKEMSASIKDSGQNTSAAMKEASQTTAAAMNKLADKIDHQADALSLLRENSPLICRYGKFVPEPGK